jgi:hypothetical protein
MFDTPLSAVRIPLETAICPNIPLAVGQNQLKKRLFPQVPSAIRKAC